MNSLQAYATVFGQNVNLYIYKFNTNLYKIIDQSSYCILISMHRRHEGNPNILNRILMKNLFLTCHVLRFYCYACGFGLFVPGF